MRWLAEYYVNVDTSLLTSIYLILSNLSNFVFGKYIEDPPEIIPCHSTWIWNFILSRGFIFGITRRIFYKYFSSIKTRRHLPNVESEAFFPNVLSDFGILQKN
jgi:hypothetical protein